MQPALLGARLGNFRLGYRPSALVALRQTKVRITLAGLPVRVREGSPTIQDVANDAPNTCSLTIDTANPPVAAQRLRITINSDAPRLLFDGALETVTEAIEGWPQRVVYPCTAQDDTPRANRRLPLGYWENISATIVAQELVAQFAPGFTTVHVQAGLPNITVHFEGSEAGMSGCLRQIAKLIGGYFYWEARDLHLFTDEAIDLPDALDATPGRILDDPPISVTRDDAQLRTRVYGKGHQEATLNEVPAGLTTIPIADVSMFNPAGGQAISADQILGYTGTVVGDGGALVGEGVGGPTNAPTVAPAAGAGLAAGDYRYKATFGTAAGETLAGPASAVVTMGGTSNIAAPAAPGGTVQTVPGALGGGILGSGAAYQYKATFVSPLGETLPSPVSATKTIVPVVHGESPGAVLAVPGGSMAQGLSYDYALTWVTATGETMFAATPSNVTLTGGGPNTAVSLSALPVSVDGRVTGKRLYRRVSGGTLADYRLCASLGAAVTSHTDTVSTASIAGAGALPTTNTTGSGQIAVTVAVSSDPSVTSRKIYRTVANGSTYKLLTTLANNTTTAYTDNTADGSLGANAPTVDGTITVFSRVSVAAIPLSSTPGVTSRHLYRTVANGAVFKLLTTLANNTTTTYADSTADGSLGANEPAVNTSGIPLGSGQINAGSSVILVSAIAPFQAGGGWAFIGKQAIRYTGIAGLTLTGVPASGPGSLAATASYGSEALAAPMLVGVTGLVRALIKGAPVHIWVQRDDLAAQAALAAREGEGDGIIEHLITDDRRGEASLIALCEADLAQFAYPIVTVPYATRDVKTKSGKPIVITRTTPLIDETLTIQSVAIDQIDMYPGVAPRFTVLASSVNALRSVDDLLRRMAGELGGL